MTVKATCNESKILYMLRSALCVDQDMGGKLTKAERQATVRHDTINLAAGNGIRKLHPALTTYLCPEGNSLADMFGCSVKRLTVWQKQLVYVKIEGVDVSAL